LPVAQAGAGQAKAEIFYVPWTVLSTVSMKPEDVRKNPTAFVRINGEAEVAAFSSGLPSVESASAELQAANDIRLVIDVYDDKGGRSSYIADYYRFSTEDGRKTVAIDSKFRDNLASFLSKSSLKK
jgi:hypothetical protein